MIAGFASNKRLIITYDNYQAYFVSSDEIFDKIWKAAEEQKAIEDRAIEIEAKGQVIVHEYDRSVKLMNEAIKFQSLKNPQAIKNGEIEIARKIARKIASHLEEDLRYEYDQSVKLMNTAKVLAKLTNFDMQAFIINKSIILENRRFIIRLSAGTETDLFTQVRKHLKYMAEDFFGNAMLVVGLHVCVVALICFALTPVSVPLGLAAASIALLAPPVFSPFIYTCLDEDLQQAISDLKGWKVENLGPKKQPVFLENCSNTAKNRKISYRNCTIIVR